MDREPTGAAPPRTLLIARHGVVTRLTHWINAACLAILLMSGLQIFNAWPSLYWGEIGADRDPAWLTIGADNPGAGSTEAPSRGFVRLGAGGTTLPTTGVLGLSKVDGQPTARAFPAWATLPSLQELAAGRRWHLFFAWCFVANGLLYLLYAAASGHFKRDLLPTRDDVRPRHLWREVLDHARLRFPKGEKARRYNALQKLTYLAVIVVLLPAMVLTGLTMSPGVDASMPWLLDLFGGRQSARSIHFISASLLVLFTLVHVAMVLLSGFWNNMRSMITGRYAIDKEDAR